MITLKLTEKEVELITTALGIAEKAYTDLHKKLVETVNVRGGELTANTDFHHISCKFADLNNSIANTINNI